jgi:hypothetical protein
LSPGDERRPAERKGAAAHHVNGQWSTGVDRRPFARDKALTITHSDRKVAVAEPTKKLGWLSTIESRDDALKVVRESSSGFFLVAAIQAALSFVVGFSILFDAAVYAIGGFFLRRFKSRVAAVVLLLLAALAAFATLANRFGEKVGGGSNIILAAIVLWTAIRAVEATFKLRGRFAAETTTNQTPPT